MTLTQTVSETGFGSTPEEHHFRWRRAMRDRLMDLELRPGNSRERPPSSAGSTAAVDLGDVLVTDWHCPPDLEGVRGSTAAAKEPDSISLFMVTTGRQVVQTPTDTVMLRPGAVLLVTTRLTGKIVIREEVRKRTVRVPMTALTPHDTGLGIPDFLCLDSAENPLAHLTKNFVSAVCSERGHMTPADVEGARNALLVLVAGMIRARQAPDVGERDFLPFLRRALEDWIADHLSEGAIRVGDLAAAHSVAPRTVHRAFATTGDTMGSVVRAHRLAAARNDLVHTAASVAAIAHRWGFCDASHLGREFRREFSMSPGDYRAAHGIA